MKAKLTTEFVNTAKPAERVYKVWDTEIKGYFLRVMPSGTKTYCIQYNHIGKSKTFTIGKSGKFTAKTARKHAFSKISEIANGHDIQQDKKEAIRREKSEKYQSLGGFIEHMYKDWVLAERKSGADTLYILNRDFGYLYSRRMLDLKAWDVQKWRSEKLKTGLKPSSLNRRLMALKAVLSKAVQWEVIDRHPLINVKPLKLDKLGRVRYLTDDEEQRLRVALSKRELDIGEKRNSGNEWRKVRGYELKPVIGGNAFADYLKPIVLLALNTGMRRGELFDLTWDNVDLKGKFVTIEGATAKSGSTRHIPLNAEALGLLKACSNQCEGNSLVFPNPNTGKRLNNIKRSWAGLLKLAGISDFRFHDLRHHFASSLVMAGVDLNTVRELLGHADLTMTLRYAHLAPEHKAAAVAVLDEVRAS